ncbi:META domain-containing protein [Bacteroidales bacterium OttesenSCG-928-B11]|nr:META domain-containing protein [Bacteroidales bacterium OttesenSCG-928-E04]MDL2312535.1 META domain-containing protein [Bacteroidales bacterium OttesenSCG-928-B11]MDL2326492.1 META domain-containing protein [Bacteroidales bacterium OttesenSCG-928-A14]
MKTLKFYKASFLYPAFFLIAIVVLCSAGKPSKSKQQLNPFNGQEWFLTDIEGIPIDSLYSKVPFIVFDTNGRIYGNLSCNSFFGSYLMINKKKVDLSYAGSTKMLCSDMALEKKFSSALKSDISHYWTDGKTLVLLERKREILRFSVKTDDK